MNPTFYLLVLSTVGLWTASHVHCSYDPEPVSSDIIQQPDLANTIVTNIQTQSAPFSLKTTTPDSFPVAFTQRTARREVRAQGTVVREKAREEEGFFPVVFSSYPFSTISAYSPTSCFSLRVVLHPL